MERVRDAAVAPVEEQVPPVAPEHLPVVEVVMLDRLRDSRGGEGRAELLESREGLLRKTAIGGLFELAKLLRQDRHPVVGRAEVEQLLRVRRENVPEQENIPGG